MGLKDIGATLPPGFRFNPSDEELICHYLSKKIANEEVSKGTMMEIDLHTCEPWKLPEMAKLNASEWYFFSFRDRKYATGFRTNRATTCGYWKATGKDRTVLKNPFTSEVVGMRKTLVFYLDRAPNGIKTCWIMHEFRLESPHAPPKEDWVLCRVFYKSKQREKNTSAPSCPIRTPPTNTFQNNFKPNVTSSPPNKKHNNINISIPTPLQNKNSTFHEHNLVVHPCEFQQLPLNPNSIFHHFTLDTNIVDLNPIISINAIQDYDDHRRDINNNDDDWLKFSWEVKEDENNDMDVVSTLEDQLGFGLDDNSMTIFP